MKLRDQEFLCGIVLAMSLFFLTGCHEKQATPVRTSAVRAYEHGGGSMTTSSTRKSGNRAVQRAYPQLIGAYLTAAAQLNLATGSETIP